MKFFHALIGVILMNAISLLGCSVFQTKQSNLPEGIELIPKTDGMQLGNPLWSPDGKLIVAGKTIYPNPDFCLFCQLPYSEIYLISSSTREMTSFMHEENAALSVRGWYPKTQKIIVSSYGTELGNGLFLVDVNDATSAAAPAYLDENDSIDWSRDGNKVVIFDRVLYIKRELKILDLVTDEETLLYTITGTNDESIDVSEPSLSPDGKMVAFSYGKSDIDYRSVDTEIYFLYIETKQLVQFTHDSSHDNDSPQFSPDGKMIAYQEYYQDKSEWRTVIVELDSGCEWEIPLPNAYTSSWAPDSQKLVIGGDGIYIYIVDLYQLFGDEFGNSTTCP